MKKRAFTLLQLLIVLALLAIVAMILFPVFARRPESHGRPSCQSNLKQIGLAFFQYTQDYNERFPPVALNPISNNGASSSKPYGWADAIQPYLKSTQVFHCYAEADARPRSDNPTRVGYTDYWINSNVAGSAMGDLDSAMKTLLCGEGNYGGDTTDARYNRNKLPYSWRADKKSPAYRHLDTANYLFADGHVKSLKPTSVAP